MQKQPLNIVLQNSPKAIEELKSTIDVSFHSLAMSKALELATHHARYILLKPYVGGRSDAMVSLQQDTSGQAPDDGQPLVEEAKQLINELAEETAAAQTAEAKPTNEEALESEKDLLVTELAEELIQLSEDNDDDDSDDDEEEELGEDECETSGQLEKHQTYIASVDECQEAAREVLDALVQGFLTDIPHDKLVALSDVNMENYSDFTWNAAENGLVTFILKP